MSFSILEILKHGRERLKLPKRLIHTYLYWDDIGLRWYEFEVCVLYFHIQTAAFFNILASVKGHPAVILKSHSRQMYQVFKWGHFCLPKRLYTS